MSNPTYSESAHGVMITYQRAIRELKKHGILKTGHESARADFDRECWHPNMVAADIPWEATIDAKHVMEWLGY